MDVLAASPVNPHRPAKSEEPLAPRCSLKCMKQLANGQLPFGDLRKDQA